MEIVSKPCNLLNPFYLYSCPTIHLSVTLSPPKQLGRILPNLLHHFPSWYGSTRATLFFCASVHPLSIHLYVMLSRPKSLGGIQPNLLHHFPSWKGCARATLFFHSSVLPCIRHPSPPKPAGGNSTKLATSLPLMVRVCESNIIFLYVCLSMRPSSDHLSVIISPPKPLGEIQPNLLHHFPSR